MAKVGRASRNASLLRVETVSADKTIVSAETGELYLIDASSAGNFTITLPASKAGAYFTFLLAADSNGAAEVMIDAGTGKTISGMAVDTAGNLVTSDLSDQKIIFPDSAGKGSKLSIVSDGTNWLIVDALCDIAFVETNFS